MRSPFGTSVHHLLFATLVGALAVVGRALAQPELGDAVPFVFAFPAVVLASLLWGAIPGIVTAVVCVLGIWWPDIPPTVVASQQATQFGSFVACALFIAIVCDRLRGPRLPSLVEPSHDPNETALGTWLGAVFWFALCVPLAAFVAAAWWSLDRAEAVAEASLTHASDLAYRQAQRTLTIAEEIARRADQASLLPDPDLRDREAALHLRLSDMVSGLTAVVNANIWDASGSPVARSDWYPVDRAYSIADRAYFEEQRISRVPLGVSEVMTGRLTGKQILNVAIRRYAADGAFNGIVSVSLAPTFFSDYYQSLAREEPTLATFALVRADGAILARWPNDIPTGYLANDSALMRSVASGAESGRLKIAADSGRGTQMVGFRRVGALPIYVVTGISRTAMLRGWANFVGVLAAILLPTTAGLVFVTWVAIRKTRRETAVSLELQDQIRARADAERQLLEAQRLETLAFVTGSVAHDFNNLLMVITSSLHLHRKRRPDVADDKTLAAISRSVESGARLTRQLLSFSRKQALRPEVIRFQDWLPAAESLMRSSLGSTAIWTSSVDADTRPVKVDPGELELALINVVINAKLAMPLGGRLNVHVSDDTEAPPDAPMVIVCVVDTGEGIAADVMPKVLQPFFTTRRKGVGSGLGLTQVEGFCVQSGGRVSIESVVGQGTTLCMHLPAAVDESTRAVAACPVPAGRVEARLLLVEDNDEVGRTTEQMLQGSGLTVVRVTSADAALAYLATAAPAPQIVLSDIAMPGSMNGIGLASELARLYPRLPVVLNTGYADQIEEAMDRGMRVLQKPVSAEVLLAEVKARLVAADEVPSGLPAA